MLAGIVNGGLPSQPGKFLSAESRPLQNVGIKKILFNVFYLLSMERIDMHYLEYTNTYLYLPSSLDSPNQLELLSFQNLKKTLKKMGSISYILMNTYKNKICIYIRQYQFKIILFYLT